jgi:hypothetical protein
MAVRLVRSPVLLTGYAAVAAYLTFFYFLHYPIPSFWLRMGEMGAAGVGVGLSALVGGALWKLLRLPEAESRAENFLFRVGAGLPVLSLGLLGLGSAGFFRPWAILIFLGAVGIVSAPAVVQGVEGLAGVIREVFDGWGWVAGGFGVFGLGLALLCAFAPPTYYDSLVYHLALPAKYLQEGRIGFVPFSQYAHFPQNMEMIYGAFLALSDDVSAQVFNVMLAGLTAVAAARLGRRWFQGFRWDILLFVTAPCALLLSTETYVETPMAFAVTLGLMSFVRALETGDRRWWTAAGLFGGFAAGVKYTGALTPALLALFALSWPGTKNARARVGDALAVGGTAFLLFLPWLVKNAVLTGGNPVFPFLPTFFPAKNVHLSVESARAYFQVLNEYRGSSGLLTELFLMPFRLATNVTSFGGGYDVTGDLGWALPLILFPLGLALWRRGAGLRGLWLYACAHILAWGSLRPVLRFLFPLFPVVCLLGGAGLSAVLSGAPAWGRRVVAGAAALFLASNGVLFYGVESVRDPFPVSIGWWMTRDQYLSRKLDLYAGCLWCKRNLPEYSRLLMIGDQRGYYCPRRYTAPMALLPTPLREWADGRADGEALRAKFVDLGFSHLFFNRREAERLKGDRVLDLTPSGRRAWEDFLARSREIYRDDSVSVYDLKS